MAESIARSIFGIHDIRFLNTTTWESVARLRILGDVTIDMPAEFVNLKGGSNLFIWDSAVGSFNPTCSITGREINADMMSTVLGATVTEYVADSTGDVIDEANVNGTSVYDTTEGIATVTLNSGDEDEAKEGWYVVKAKSASTVDVYAVSSSNFQRGTAESYEDDDGKITASPITIPASGASAAVTNFGIKFTGGSSSAIAMTTNDTMCFYVQKPHGGAFSAIIGAQPMDFDEYVCVISSETNAGAVYNFLLYRVKPAGGAIPFKEKNYMEYSINMSIMYDSDENAIGVLRASFPE